MIEEGRRRWEELDQPFFPPLNRGAQKPACLDPPAQTCPFLVFFFFYGYGLENTQPVQVRKGRRYSILKEASNLPTPPICLKL
jgi:hypothetical protein